MVRVFTNGCFDLLHASHVAYLNEAAQMGTHLTVAINGDHSVRQLKGSNRPIYNEQERLYMLSHIRCVDCTFIYNSFEEWKNAIASVAPHIYVKGGDYSIETIDKDELAYLNSKGIEIRFTGKYTGDSTTDIIKKIKS